MKRIRLLFTLAAMLLMFACSNDPLADNLPSPNPSSDNSSHSVPVEQALAELHAVLEQIDGPSTRAGSQRRIGSITVLKTAEVLPATRSGEYTDTEDLVYIANFENDKGYAILGADDRLAPVIAITEEGNLTPEEFTAAARGEYDDMDAPPVLPEIAAYALGLGGGIGGNGGGNLPINPGIIDTGGELNPGGPTITRYGEWKVTLQRGPFLLTKWGQKMPYNYYAPSLFGMRCYAGCVAVALGQIMAQTFTTIQIP